MKYGLLMTIVLAVIGTVFWFYFGFKYIVDARIGSITLNLDLISKVLLVIFGYVSLLCGVLLGTVHRELITLKEKNQKEVKITELMGSIWKLTDFWLGIFASPVVYIVLLQAVDLSNISVSNFIGVCLVGLQNGFFCENFASLLKGKTEK